MKLCEGAFEQGEITSPQEQELPENAGPSPIKKQIMTDIEYYCWSGGLLRITD